MNWYKIAQENQQEFLDIIDEVSKQPLHPDVQEKIDLQNKIDNIDLSFSQYDSDREYRKKYENKDKDKDEYEVYESFFEDQDNALSEVLEEFVTLTKNNPNAKQPWTTASFPRVKKIWEDYMKTGFVRDEKGINQIAEIIIKNVHKLEANTYLMGHTQGDPSEHFEDYGITTEEQKEIFYDYAEAENGQARISDYGLEPLQKEVINLERTFDPEERLQIIDRMFNIFHQRSDLPAMFIEGGTSSLDKLFGSRPSKVEAKSNNWYKTSQKEREYPVAAVVIADGIKFEGKTHGEAIQRARDAGHIHKDEDGYLIDTNGNSLAFTGAIDLFKTNWGRIIDRFEAFNLGEATGAENIPEHELDVEKDTTTPSLSTSTTPSSESAISTRQIYTRDDVIQNREDLAPSRLRERRQ